MDRRTGMPRVGMVGGGQLARMTHQAALALGQTLRVLSVSETDSAALATPDVVIGHHTDLDALRRFSTGCDVVTFDHEHVPSEHITTLTAEGHVLHPGAEALVFAQDKARMRDRLARSGIPVPAYRVLEAGAARGAGTAGIADAGTTTAVGAAGATGLSAAVEDFAVGHGWPVVIKVARGGYDGRGVWVVRDPADLRTISAEVPDAGVLVLEAFVTMRRELAAVVARSPFGQAAAWPVVQTVQENGICVEVVAPAPGLDDDVAEAAEKLALQIAGEMGVVGILAVELFQVDPNDLAPDGLLINELAMRPHNSAHWTMDGAVTSQFEQHLRAVLDYPLGGTAALAPFTVMANVLGGPVSGTGTGSPVPQAAMGMDERVHHLAARFPDVKVHLYGKAFRPGRKLGHVNVLGSDLGALRRRARLAATWLGDGVWTDGYHLPASADAAEPVAREGAG